MTITPATLRLDAKGRPCGQSHIAADKTCRQKGSFPTRKAIAAGLGVAALGAGAYAMSRRGSTSAGAAPTPSGLPRLPGSGPSPTQPRLPGLTPRALLAAAPARKSKTQRMRENTAAAVKNAEGRIAQTAREEIRRVAQIGNTMAAAGEATGMATKLTARNLRLRVEAARRKYEPGYRRPDQKRLPEGVQAQLPQSTAPRTREAIPLDPRTGQPRRRRAQGFGRTDNYIQHYAPTQLQPPTRRDACWEGYEQVGMKRKGKRRVPNCVPTKKRAQADTEDGKKYTKVVTNPETGRKNKVRYGAKGYTIAPGTDKGDNYCARSFGDMKSHGKDCSGPDRNTPLCLSRAKWKCSGKTSRRS
jgi:hypothetical protein